MKKIATAILATLLLSSPALAKTQGHYVGVDWILSSQKNRSASDTTGAANNLSDHGNSGFGINYRYAFNYEGIFLAPGVFYDKLKFNNDIAKVNYRYGVKLDLGYDLTRDFALYFTNGLANTNYDHLSGGDHRVSTANYFWGFGGTYKLTKDVLVNVAYVMQKDEFAAQPGFTKGKGDLNSLKVGLSYNF